MGSSQQWLNNREKKPVNQSWLSERDSIIFKYVLSDRYATVGSPSYLHLPEWTYFIHSCGYTIILHLGCTLDTI